METHPEFAYDWFKKEIKPDPEWKNPAFWIRDLIFLKMLSPAPDVIRRISLRKGINILWAKPFNPEEAGNAGEAFAGHAAGKTLFCRMIRYLLGEKYLGDELAQKRVSDGFPNGWVMGTVVVDETPWLVARPFADKQGQFAVRDCTVSDFLNGGVSERPAYKLFQQALHQRVTRDHKLREFPDNAGTIDFQHILPWLTRDQEARYGSPAGWRDTSSGAVPMATDSEDRNFLMRVVLNLIDPKEKPELDHNAELLKKQNQLKKNEPILKDRARVDFERLKADLNAGEFEKGFIETLTLESDLLADSVEQKLNARLESLKGLIEEIPSDSDVAKLQAAHVREIEKRVQLQRDISDLEQRLSNKKTEWGRFQNRQSEEQLKEHQRNMDMPAGYCGAPIEVVQNHKCQLWREWSNIPDEDADSVDMLEAMNRGFERDVEKLQTELDAKRGELAEATNTESAAMSALAGANKKRHEVFAFLKIKKATFESLLKLAERARAAHVDSKKSETDLKNIGDELNRSYEIQQTIRAAQNDILRAFAAYFEAVCQHILGKDVGASVSIERRNLVLETFDRGPLTSAAIETVKILALDLAALWSAIERRSFHPAFLIHDGPREADMDAWMYRRIFTFVRKLEKAYGDNKEPAFQYIITTTEAPPEDMRGDPWLLQPPLSARTENERLLRTDLR